MNYQRKADHSFLTAAISHLSLVHCYSEFSQYVINDCFQMLLTLKQNHQLWVLAQRSSTFQEIQWLCTKVEVQRRTLCRTHNNNEGRDNIWYQCNNTALEWWPVSWWPPTVSRRTRIKSSQTNTQQPPQRDQHYQATLLLTFPKQRHQRQPCVKRGAM